MTAPALVYMFCFITCAVCAGLLVRSWFKTRTRLILWIAISFVFLAVNNFFLFADTTLTPPDTDLRPLRVISGVLAVSVLIFGLIWEAE
jgi:dolichyl-phosphate-mannose--protein O-mannosyl transferase